MNGPHDVGGLHGFGPVIPDADSDHFHAEWERRLFALTLAMGATGTWNLDQSRAAREKIGALRYRQSSYFQIWHAGLEALLIEHGLVSQAELESGERSAEPVPLSRTLAADEVAAALARGAPVAREVSSPARFAPGDRVRTRNLQPASHTRLPGYIRAKPGTIARLHGAHVLPDEHARTGAEAPEWLYSVSFDAHEVFGAETTADALYVDCWESYLEPHP
ncbi:MAG: nitrile hydratase subunit beta [Burkholderiaceae bacterium]